MAATSTATYQINAFRFRSRSSGNAVLCLIAADTITLLLSVSISLAFKNALHGIQAWGPYLRLWPFLFVFIATYAAAGLYSVVALSPPQELRRATLSSALIFLFLGAATVSFRGGTKYFTWTLLMAMILSVILLPLLRGLARGLFAREEWWGNPAVIFTAGAAGREVVKTLVDQPSLGLRPIAVIDKGLECPRTIHGVPVIQDFELAAAFPQPSRFTYGVVAMPDAPHPGFLSTIERYGRYFSRILVIPNLSSFSTMWVDTKIVGGRLGLEVCQQAFIRERHWPKRVLDLTLTLLGAVVIVPLVALVALWIKLDSPGPVFYSQPRIGQDGREFRAWKFRSMMKDADRILTCCLEQNARLREEWERDHKLRDDPRVTTIGRFLRRTSLDELPQLWNVLKGEMSLVGPRPIVEAEIPRYGAKFDLYTKVKSGLTGLWQISGRNDTSYQERVRLDSFYVRNWSVWLDLYILFRTIETVILGKGAY